MNKESFKASAFKLMAHATVKVMRPSKPFEGQEMKHGILYRVPLKNSICSNGTENVTYLRKAATNKLVIFFMGGGVSWCETTAANPLTLESMASGANGFYVPDMSAASEFGLTLQVGNGIFVMNNNNLFYDWNFAIISYATGDFHVGNSECEYTDSHGKNKAVHYSGQKNFKESMKIIKQHFPKPEKLLIAGSSAGAFGAPIHVSEIMDTYPECKDVTVYSDSALLVWDGWKKTVRDVWKSTERIAGAVQTDNLSADWYKLLVSERGKSIRYLASCSNRDYILTMFENYMRNGVFDATDADCDEFRKELKIHVETLKQINPDFGIYINDFTVESIKVGTEHCILGSDNYYKAAVDNISPEKWLCDALDGNTYDVGLHLLDDK